LNENLKGKRIQVLWPDTGKWYNADVIKVNVKKRTAKLFYVDSEEKEDINLYEAMLNMEVSWPYKGGVVGKTPSSTDKDKKRKQRDESASESASDDAPRDPPAKKKTGAVAAKRAPPKRQPTAGAGPSDATRRLFADKVKAAMLVASRELNEKEPSASAANQKSSWDPERAADGVERAAYALFATDVKKYNDKARSLLFNLNDPKNPSLRARVLTGELKPETLASMTPADMAPRDVQDWRREREARLGEDAFLAAGPATRLVKTSKGEELVVVGGGNIVEEGDGLGNRQEETLAHQAAAAAARAAQQAQRAAAPAAAPAAEVSAVPAAPELTTFEAFAADAASSDEDDEDAPAEDAGGDARADDADDDEYDPAKAFADDADAPERAPADADADADADAAPTPTASRLRTAKAPRKHAKARVRPPRPRRRSPRPGSGAARCSLKAWGSRAGARRRWTASARLSRCYCRARSKSRAACRFRTRTISWRRCSRVDRSRAA